MLSTIIKGENMYSNKKIMAFIPARGGSKGIKNKNMVLLNGQPLIWYSIMQARQSQYVDDIYISTDSEIISDYALSLGFDNVYVIKRPDELAQDTSKTIDAVVHTFEVLKAQNKQYDYMVELQPTSPLRQVQFIDEIIVQGIDKNQPDIVSVHTVHEHPILMRWKKDDDLTTILPTSSTVRRQDMPSVYYVDGMLYLYRTDLLTLETSLNDARYGYEVDEKYCVDINNPTDLIECERRLKETAE